MANLTPIPNWGNVVAWDTTTVANGIQMNSPLQTLLNQNYYSRKHGGVLPFSLDITYDTNDYVKLSNGKIVRSKIDSNTTNPNLDMSNWEEDDTLTTKYGFRTEVSTLAENVADLSKIPMSGVSGKVIMRIAQYPTNIGTKGSRYYVCSSKGGNSDSYVFFELRRGFTTGTGSLGGSGEFLRVTSVYEGSNAWVGRHAKYGESASGDWSEVVYTPTGFSDANKFSRSITSGVDLWKYYSVQGSGSKYIEFNVPFNKNGEANLQFYATSGSATDVNVYIDGILYTTMSLVSTTARISRLTLNATSGYHVVRVERPTTGSLNVFGANYGDVKDSIYNEALDGFVVWHNNVLFTNGEGASDYAVLDSNSNLFGGSFHGGEILQSENFAIDGVIGDPMANITLCKSIEIRQQTSINWSANSLSTYSTHHFNEDSGYQLDVTFSGDITTNTFYTTMHTTPENFSMVTYPEIVDFSAEPDGFKKLERSNVVVQEDSSSGKRVYTEMTLFNNDQSNIYGAPSIRKVTGSYNKLYYGIAISSPQDINITTLKTSFRKKFV